MAHAKHRPPSAAYRWLGCPASAYIMPLYPNDESDASLKGEVAHKALEIGVLFGFEPDTGDVDVDLNIIDVLRWIKEQRDAYGKDCTLYAEQQYDIPETGEFGTSDLTFVTPSEIHIADYKNGYVPVNVKKNPQLLLYLCGAIAKFGERKRYKITVIQPNYDHVDGPYRTFEVDNDLLEWFRGEVKYAVNAPQDEFKAGKHCKTSYCPHRGSCVEFAGYARTELRAAYFPSDVHALDDVQLSQALDGAEQLKGQRDELRKEAMRRILQQDRHVPGYKIVRSRKDREFAGDEGRKAAYEALTTMGYDAADLFEKTPVQIGETIVYEQKALTVAGVERLVKAKFKSFGRGQWKVMFDQYIKPHIREFSGGLTLERAIDGRPSHTRGSEFGPLKGDTAQQVGQVVQVVSANVQII